MNIIIFDESLRITYRGMEDFDLCVRRNFIFDNFKIIFPEIFKAKVEFIDGTYVGKATIIGLEPEDRRETHTFSWNFRDYKYTNDVRMLDVKEALSCDYENAKCYDFKMDGIEDYFQIDAECRIILSACDYIMNYKRDKIDKKAIGTTISDVGHNANRNNSTVKKVYLLKDIVNYVYEQKCNKHNEITCPCWEVRGFYRHYKSGKVIWVNSFKKGKQRDRVEPKPKTYIAKER